MLLFGTTWMNCRWISADSLTAPFTGRSCASCVVWNTAPLGVHSRPLSSPWRWATRHLWGLRWINSSWKSRYIVETKLGGSSSRRLIRMNSNSWLRITAWWQWRSIHVYRSCTAAHHGPDERSNNGPPVLPVLQWRKCSGARQAHIVNHRTRYPIMPIVSKSVALLFSIWSIEMVFTCSPQFCSSHS